MSILYGHIQSVSSFIDILQISLEGIKPHNILLSEHFMTEAGAHVVLKNRRLHNKSRISTVVVLPFRSMVLT